MSTTRDSQPTKKLEPALAIRDNLSFWTQILAMTSISMWVWMWASPSTSCAPRYPARRISGTTNGRSVLGLTFDRGQSRRELLDRDHGLHTRSRNGRFQHWKGGDRLVQSHFDTSHHGEVCPAFKVRDEAQGLKELCEPEGLRQ